MIHSSQQNHPATKLAHSPAPWRIGDAGHTIFGPPNGAISPEIIATVRNPANAPVIHAAPQLLKALQDCMATLVHITRDPDLKIREVCLKNTNLVATSLYAARAAIDSATPKA